MKFKAFLFCVLAVYMVCGGSFQESIFPFLANPSTHPSFYESSPILTKNPSFPIWPDAFNATLLKLNFINSTIRWTKLYYDHRNQRSSFEFYDGYVEKNLRWGKMIHLILFVNTTVWFIDPIPQRCSIRSRSLPSISPSWLRTTKFNRNLLFRDQWAEEWEFPPGTPNQGLKYYARVGKSNAERVPLRSTNQIEDPGDTDYTDFVVGSQDDNHFSIPRYCPR